MEGMEWRGGGSGIGSEWYSETLKDNSGVIERIKLGYIALTQNDSTDNYDLHFYSPDKTWITKFISQTSIKYANLVSDGYAKETLNSGSLTIEKSGLACVLNLDANIVCEAEYTDVLIASFPESYAPLMSHNVITHPHADLTTSVTIILNTNGIHVYASKAGTHNIRATIPYFING